MEKRQAEWKKRENKSRSNRGDKRKRDREVWKEEFIDKKREKAEKEKRKSEKEREKKEKIGKPEQIKRKLYSITSFGKGMNPPHFHPARTFIYK